MDEMGLCRLTFTKDGYDAIGYANGMWGAFRRIVDGCSDGLYDCTAMDSPFDAFFFPDDYAEQELKSPFVGISRRFLDAVESVSDLINCFWGNDDIELNDDGDSVKMSVDQIAVARANRLYFDSFMLYYKNRFTSDDWNGLSAEMDLRMRKAEIAFDNVSKTKDNRYMEKQYQNSIKMLRDSHMVLIVSIIALAVSIVTVAISKVF